MYHAVNRDNQTRLYTYDVYDDRLGQRSRGAPIDTGDKMGETAGDGQKRPFRRWSGGGWRHSARQTGGNPGDSTLAITFEVQGGAAEWRTGVGGSEIGGCRRRSETAVGCERAGARHEEHPKAKGDQWWSQARTCMMQERWGGGGGKGWGVEEGSVQMATRRANRGGGGGR